MKENDPKDAVRRTRGRSWAARLTDKFSVEELLADVEVQAPLRKRWTAESRKLNGSRMKLG